MRRAARGLTASVRFALVACLALLAGACASPNTLATRSEKALASGEPQKAYERARSALKKDPENARARRAMTAAAERLMAGSRERLLAVAPLDTAAAAWQSLELDGFRRELADFRIVLAPDSAFDSQERRVREGAAGIYYRRAEEALLARLPKRAYDDFGAAHGFVPGFRDVGERLREAYAEALARVALLPFANHTDVRGLPKEISDHMVAELTRRLRSKDFRFTELIDPEEVYAQVTLADLDRMGRRDALRLGRELDADQVVTGRYYGLRSRTDTESYQQTVFRKVVDRDAPGGRTERYVERELDIVARTRDVTVHYEFEVLATEDGAVLARGGDAVDVSARTLHTSFQAEGDCDDYFLASPDLKRAEPERAKRLESEWKERFGSWTLPQLLERARKESGRTRYRSSNRGDFYGNTTDRPVFLADLPPEDELVIIALQGVWRPVLDTLRDLDRK